MKNNWLSLVVLVKMQADKSNRYRATTVVQVIAKRPVPENLETHPRKEHFSVSYFYEHYLAYIFPIVCLFRHLFFSVYHLYSGSSALSWKSIYLNDAITVHASHCTWHCPRYKPELTIKRS